MVLQMLHTRSRSISLVVGNIGASRGTLLQLEAEVQGIVEPRLAFYSYELGLRIALDCPRCFPLYRWTFVVSSTGHYSAYLWQFLYGSALASASLAIHRPPPDRPWSETASSSCWTCCDRVSYDHHYRRVVQAVDSYLSVAFLG